MAFPPSTCIAHFVAGVDETVSGGRISQWDDQSGNDNHAVQATGGSQPYSITNSLGKAAVRCDTGDFMTIGNSMTVAPRDCTLIFFGRVLTGSNVTLIGLSAYAGSAGHMRITSGVSEPLTYRAANRSSLTLRPRINNGLVVVCCRGAGSDVHTNDGSVTGLAAITVDNTPREVFFGTPDIEIYEILVCNSGTLSAQDLADLQAHAATTHDCPASHESQILFGGDSITAGYGLGDTELHYPAQCLTAATAHWRMLNGASSGATVATAEAFAVATDATFDAAFDRNVHLILFGRNDLAGAGTVDAFYAALVSYIEDRVAAGWEVWVGTIIHETAIQAKIDDANQRIRGENGHPGIIADAGATKVVNFAALTISTSDGTHPDSAGAATMAGAVIPLLTEIILTSPANGATGVAVLPTFEWTGDADRLEIAQMDSWSDPDYVYTVSGTSHTIDVALEGGTLWYWRLRNSVTEVVGPVRRFTTVAASNGNRSRPSISIGMGIGL